MRQNIFLIGFMGAGKSTVAVKLTEQLKMELCEMDQMIAEQQGISIAQIFEEHGEDYFRDLETKLLEDIQAKEQCIVSCGGGAVIREGNVVRMKRSGRIILLTAEPETIFERVRNSKNRPILNGNMNVEYIRKLMEKRKALYENVADIKIVTDGKDIQQICDEIIAKTV